MHLSLFTLGGTEEDFLINTDTDINTAAWNSVVFEMHCRKMGVFEAKRDFFLSCQHLADQYAEK